MAGTVELGSGARDGAVTRAGWGRALGFLWLWGCVGYSLGTSVLLGPVMWVTEHMREAGWSETGERIVVVTIILAYVAASLAAAWQLARIVTRTPWRHVRLGVPLLATLAAGGALWLWLTPSQLQAQREVEQQVGARFTFGPYPTAERMHELRQEGFTGVISLLHPAVVPFEPKLLADEREAAERAGIELIHLPMLPWVGENTGSLAELERLARAEEGRYYVHCYLGRDRVRMARAIVERYVGKERIRADELPPALKLADGKVFERGAVVALEPDVFLTPLPTDEEMMAWVIPFEPATVVSLLDDRNEDDRPWIERERRILEPFDIDFVSLPLDAPGPQVAAAVETVRALPRPLIVHAFLGPSTGRSPTAQAFLEAWRRAPPGAGEDAVAATPAEETPDVAADPEPSGAIRSLVPGWARPFVPSARQVVLLGPVLLFGAGLAAAFAGRLRAVRGIRTPYTRKIFHFIIFSSAAALQLAGGLALVGLFSGLVTAIVLYAVWRGDGFAFYEALARPTDAPRRSLFILVPLATTAAGGVLANLLFGVFAPVGYLVGGWGDAVGEPVGTRWGLRRYSVPSIGGVRATRSLEGSGAVFAVSIGAAFLALIPLGVAPLEALGAALLAALAATAAEAVSHHGLDNLTVQLASAGTVFVLLG